MPIVCYSISNQVNISPFRTVKSLNEKFLEGQTYGGEKTYEKIIFG